MKRIKFVTLGCKVNQYDTQEIRQRCLERGAQEASGSCPPDICVVNTCTVTAKADRESLYQIRRLRRLHPAARIVVTGCMAGHQAALLRKQPGVWLVAPNSRKNRLAARLFGPQRPVRSQEGISSFEGHARAFIKVQDGCDNFCSYCIVPLVRGRSRSREPHAIVAEARRLAGQGCKEIVLTGICLGAFGKDLRPRRSLAGLIGSLERIEGICRIRLSSIEAADVTEELIETMAVSSKLCRHLHIPLQSGDDAVLKRMHRRSDSRDYACLIDSVRRRIPDIAITTDVLVGFPQETEEQFANTVRLVRKVMPSRVHVFGFSPRPKTAAAKMKGAVCVQAVQDRSRRLRQEAGRCAAAFLKRSRGSVQAVLLEGRSRQDPDSWEGYTGTYIKVRVASRKDLTNALVRVKLSAGGKDFLRGCLLKK